MTNPINPLTLHNILDPEWEKDLDKHSKSELIEFDLALTQSKDKLLLELKGFLLIIKDKNFLIDDIRKVAKMREKAKNILDKNNIKNPN